MVAALADKIILALDIATVTGWAEGPISGKPLAFGSVRLAPEGSCAEAIGAGMLDFIGSRMLAFRPSLIVYEAPIDPRHLKKTNLETFLMLSGLPMVMGSVAYKLGLYTFRKVDPGDLKQYWHGKRGLPRQVVKPLTLRKMRALGYDVHGEDAADAIAVHRYFAAYLDPAYRVEAQAGNAGAV